MLRRAITVLLVVILTIFVIRGTLYFVLQQTVLKINYIKEPSTGMPILVNRGGEITIKLKAGDNLKIHKTALAPVFARGDIQRTLRVVSMKRHTGAGMWEIHARIPPLVREGLYDLLVFFEIGNVNYTDMQVNAVGVTEGQKGRSNFIVMGDLEDFAASGLTRKRWSDLQEIFNEVNLLNPDFVVVPGGLRGGMWAARDLRRFYNLLQDTLLVPAYILPSETDLHSIKIGGHILVDARNAWSKFFSLRSSSFDMGNVRFVFLNTADCVQRGSGILAGVFGKYRHDGCVNRDTRKWLAETLEEADKTGKCVVLFTHHPPAMREWLDEHGNRIGAFDEPSRQWLLKLLKRHKVSYVFSAHIPEDTSARGTDGTRFITTGREKDNSHLPRYRLIEIEDGAIKKVHYLAAPNAISFGKLTIKTARPNDGSAARNRVVVTNALARDLYDLRALVKMKPLHDGDYVVHGADKISDYVTVNARIIFLGFDVPSMNKKIMIIRKK